MFRKLVSNLPFSPSLINQLSFYSVRLKKEQFTRKLGLIFTALAIVVQTLTFLVPAQATLAASGNDIIYNGNGKTKSGIIQAYNNNRDQLGRGDIQAIFNHYGINQAALNDSRVVTIRSTVANNYWSIGRAPRGGQEVAVQINGGPRIYSRTLHGWAVNKNWSALEVRTGQGVRWILLECGNIVTSENKPEVPDISVTKSVNNQAPLLGQAITYTVNVKNVGKVTARGVGARDVAPAGIEFTGPTSGANPILSPREWKTSQPFDLAPGATRTFTLQARVTLDGPRQIDNIACALGANGDANGSNNCGTATIFVRPVCPLPGKQNLPIDDPNCSSPGLKIEKVADKREHKVGDSFIYTLKVTNNGDINLPKAVVRDVPPAEIEFIEVKEPGASTFTPVSNKRDYLSKEFALRKGASIQIQLKAKVLKAKSAAINNRACVLSVGTGTTAGACDDEPITVKDFCPANPSLAKDDPRCQPPCPIEGKQNLVQNDPGCVPCDETKQDSGGNDISCLELHKRARNITQQLENANGTKANAGDSIEYTLSVTNRSKEVRKGFIIEENMEDVLEYADIIDASGAAFTDNPVKMLSWLPVDIKPNETINRTILIKIKSTIPSTPASTSDPLSYDMKLINVYGDTVRIELPTNPVKIVEQTVTTLPSTGLGTNILISTVLIMGATYFYFRSRTMVKELGLVRQQFNYGMGA